jgi:hypothetical protein
MYVGAPFNDRESVVASGAGRYHVETNVDFASNGSGYRHVEIIQYSSIDVVKDKSVQSHSAITGDDTVISVSGDFDAVVGDYFTVEVAQNCGGPLSAGVVFSAMLEGSGPQGTQGIQGVQGIAGPAGSVGPAGPVGMVWRGAWSAVTNYFIRDAVQHGGSSYTAINNSLNSQPPSVDWDIVASVGTAGVAGAPGSPGAPGAPGPVGMTWRSQWNSLDSYSIDDVVEHLGTAYIAIAANVGDPPPSLNWDVLVPAGDPSSIIYPHTIAAVLTAVEEGGFHTNTGATGEVPLTLPTIDLGPPTQDYRFGVTTAQYLKIVAPAGVTINIGTTASTPGGFVRSNIVGSTMRLVAVTSTQWFAEGASGEWRVDA